MTRSLLHLKRTIAAAAVLAVSLAGTTAPASATGGYSAGTYNGCPASAPYYKVSYTRYAVCGRYP